MFHWQFGFGLRFCNLFCLSLVLSIIALVWLWDLDLDLGLRFEGLDLDLEDWVCLGLTSNLGYCLRVWAWIQQPKF